jgi:hypothetical protein
MLVWARAVGTLARVRRRRVFSKKKMTDPSQTRTRVPVYPSIPEHEYGYRARVHEYELYAAGFSKPLILGTRI